MDDGTLLAWTRGHQPFTAYSRALRGGVAAMPGINHRVIELSPAPAVRVGVCPEAAG